MPRHHHASIFPRQLLSLISHERPQERASRVLEEVATLEAAAVHARLRTSAEGLTADAAAQRLTEYGPNVLARERRATGLQMLLRAALNPLVLLLGVLATISFVTGDVRSGGLMSAMIVLGIGLKWVQEAKADRAAARLKALISVTATVVRDGVPTEVAVSRLVPGDVVRLAAGDMVPADVRLVAAKDLFINQSALTGESLPVEKFAALRPGAAMVPLEWPDMAFLGTNVESGAGVAVVVATGEQTLLGSMAQSLTDPRQATAFDRGIERFTWMMLRIVLVMTPLVLVLNGLTKGDWRNAFFFALAVAVGLTPEMLPMIVTVCLAKGALAMGQRQVIVKRLNSIQDLGAMDVLCVDKTGTLTQDRVLLERHCDVVLREDDRILGLAYLNSFFQTGLKNVLDRAVLEHATAHVHARLPDHGRVDEIPFDFQRRVMTVVVRTTEGLDRLICKGAPEAVFARCSHFQLDGERLSMDHLLIDELREEHDQLATDGFRVLAIATRDLPPRPSTEGASGYSQADERELVLQGYVAFLDPPKETARSALAALRDHGVAVKVVTGDNDLVARKICHEVGLSAERTVLGSDVERMSDPELVRAARETTLFARVSPGHKQRIVRALQASGHVVGFLGDGINDAPALRAADVGVSVDSAVDIAKESADMILLEKSLQVLEAGVVEGRKVFANILKYVRMGASSNFGNMFSVLVASVWLPFLPMTPVQILANNLLYDISQTLIPTDDVDPDQIEKPRPWDIRQLMRYILWIGPCSSLFDCLTYALLLYYFDCRDVSTPAAAAYSASLFQAGWFIESLLTQTAIIHIIRTNRLPFWQSRASWPLLVLSGVVMATGLVIVESPLGGWLGFARLPLDFWPWLLVLVAGYLGWTQTVKTWLLRRRWMRG
ncbi:MAG: magnesium-translocating P-type ATPase [Pirellulales bacterium]